MLVVNKWYIILTLKYYIYRMSLFQSPEPAVVKPEPKRNGTSNKNNQQHHAAAKNLGSKFHDVQRKWMLSPPPLGESDSSDIDLQESINRIGTPSSMAAFPLGHSSVKCLSSKFQKLPQNGGQNGSSGVGSNR